MISSTTVNANIVECPCRLGQVVVCVCPAAVSQVHGAACSLQHMPSCDGMCSRLVLHCVCAYLCQLLSVMCDMQHPG